MKTKVLLHSTFFILLLIVLSIPQYGWSQEEQIEVETLPEAIRYNSTVMLQTPNGSYLSIPIKYKEDPLMYYPREVDTLSIKVGDSTSFRTVGHFSFDAGRSDTLLSGDTIRIKFKESKLYPNWEAEDYTEEINLAWLGTNYLKKSGPIPDFVQYWDDDGSWTKWELRKVNGKKGEPIYEGDEVYLFVHDTKEYLVANYKFGDNDFYLGVEKPRSRPNSRNGSKYRFKFFLHKE